jgi:acetyltransferase-like isoleucine patch superfamily enzyme
MTARFHESNLIHPSAIINQNVILGKHNVIGENVVIEGFKNSNGYVSIGDCNIINKDTKILAGEPGIQIGDWNVFHNNMLVMAEMDLTIGHNCWFGQNTILDGSGGLEIGNGVRVGMYSQIWTHVASGELIEGCMLFGKRKTIISDDVWLVGSCIVSSGVSLGERSIYLIGSNITKSTEGKKVYAGSPAKEMEKLNFYREVTLEDKFSMMIQWVKEFTSDKVNINYVQHEDKIIIYDENSDSNISILVEDNFDLNGKDSVFCLKNKKYLKTLSELEIKFYRFLYGHKARFLPL